MKKLLALVLALGLLCGCAALAEDTISGEMFPMEELGLSIFIPAEYAIDENATTDDGSQLLYAWAATDDSGEFLKVSAMNMEGVTPEIFLATVQAQLDPEAEIVELSCGLQAVMFFNTAEGSVCAALVDTNSNVIGFEMGPVTEENKLAAATAFSILLNSMTPIE